MPSVPCFNFRFTPSWFMIVLTAFFVCFFIWLGFWQIHRGHEKEQMLAAEQALAKTRPIKWEAGDKLPQQYQPVQLVGRYLTNIFLLDNQHQQHEFGYNALSPLVLADGSVVMVDRGWILKDETSQSFANIPIPKNIISLQGNAYYPAKNQMILGQEYEKKDNNVIVIEIPNTELLSQLLQKKVHPFIIRLDKNDAYGFVRQWPVISMPPQRHFAYAVQWFAIAFVILIIFIALNLKRNEKKYE